MTSTLAQAAPERPGEPTRPMTGADYLDRLRDGRRVWIHGERVGDITAHPAFRNTARSVARLYDALHDPAHAGVLTAPADLDGAAVTHPFFRAPRSVADLRAARDAIAVWQRMTYGWMGRSPDNMAAFLGTLGGDTSAYGPYAENARAWYRRGQREAAFLGHALINPPVDRHRPPDEVDDVYVRIEEETDAGVVVSGAKVVATGSALAQHILIGHIGPPLTDPSYATCFLVRLDNPGLRLLCRASYEQTAATAGSPFDYPLSSRLDENDAIVVLDRAVVPWEDVLIHRDVDAANGLLERSGFLPRLMLHSAVRLGVKLDFLCGLLLRATRTTGGDVFRGVQAAVGEALAWRHTVWGLSDAMVERAVPRPDGVFEPCPEYAHAFRVLGPTATTTLRHLIENSVGSGLIYLPSHASDFGDPEIRGYLDTYLRGSHGTTAVERVKLMKLLWDGVGSEFAGRHELYDRLYGGTPELTRVQALQHAEATGLVDRLGELVDTCLGEYDLHGWTTPHLSHTPAPDGTAG
ncbi:4-hydroxyphenylacetate 3-hydroxylase family protein [Allostreptomyces psammosilenae]|uniref:4-hydroxyphenylacetate 3-monooxygenase n=1 Tax=Allostreptomyces psammosilenae TaxID=1892865 RepID=A0A852ZWQ9_9ACTN|nr:4-hydroxyphenylacetate 3-hydroxylase family protein [Allostreptomyces psammosilenae]NYI06833.1 4-hydroxyphenylacetate 3-monooxygenase [Allostreptomyces psammosilenae]